MRYLHSAWMAYRKLLGKLGADWLNEKIRAREDRRRNKRIMPLIEQLDNAGLHSEADRLRGLLR